MSTENNENIKIARNLDDLLVTIKARRKKRTKIVFVSGVFNVIHPGHLRLLKFAREQGELLIVGVKSNKMASTAVVDEKDRLTGIGAVTYIDKTFLMTGEPDSIIRILKPDIVIKGSEWGNTENPEEEALKEYGGKLLFCSGEVTFSSIELIKEEFKQRQSIPLRSSQGYFQRHGIDIHRLRAVINGFNDLNVVVIGDSMVDEYIMCEALGMSQEDPVIVVRPLTTEKFVGGASVVAMHAKGLGAKVKFLSVLGKDKTADYVKNTLNEKEIEACFLSDGSRPTTVKQRFINQGKKLLRVSYLKEHPLNKDLIGDLCKRLPDFLNNADLLIFCDFNYGFLCKEIQETAVTICEKQGIYMAVDCQSSSQIGNITRYSNMDLATPTEREARLALHDRDSGLVILARQLEQKMHVKNLLLTLGSEGMLIHHPRAETYETDRLPALNPDPKDVMGAGDALLVGTSMGLASKHDIWTSAFVGGLCAAHEVAFLGNQPLAKTDLLKLLDRGML
ncbi:MAG: PfkB family carbohydrate kinase [bacterium]